MDRFDTWLNAQRGWRRLTIVAVAFYAPIGCLSFGCLAFCSLFSSSRPSVPVPTVVAIADLALPAAVGVPLGAETYRYSRRFTRALGEVELPALGVE